MRRTVWILGISAMALALFAGSLAYARAHHRGEMMKGRISAHIDELLDVAKATPDQRTAIRAARDHVFETIAEVHKDKKGGFERGLALFEADRIDPAQIAALRAQHEADHKKVGDAIVLALTDAHDALTAPQRQAVADAVRAHTERMQAHAGGRHADFFQKMMLSHIDDALGQAKATDAQKNAIHQAVERVLATVQENQKQRQAEMADALALFAAPKLDQAKVGELRARREAAARRTGDTIVQAITTAHDTLSPQQRRVVADFVRAHRPPMGG